MSDTPFPPGTGAAWPWSKLVCAWCSTVMRHGIGPVEHAVCPICEHSVVAAILANAPQTAHNRPPCDD